MYIDDRLNARKSNWIVTLDVLKCCIDWDEEAIEYNWIVTLDVLKSVIDKQVSNLVALNSNIRCIEMPKQPLNSPYWQIEY